MVKELVHDPILLAVKSEEATIEDISLQRCADMKITDRTGFIQRINLFGLF